MTRDEVEILYCYRAGITKDRKSANMKVDRCLLRGERVDRWVIKKAGSRVYPHTHISMQPIRGNG